MKKEFFNISPLSVENLLPIKEFGGMHADMFHMLGYSVLDDYFYLRREKLNQHTLIFTHSGLGRMTLGELNFEAEPGTALFLPRGSTYELNLIDGPWVNTWTLLPDNNQWAYLRDRVASVYHCNENGAIEKTFLLLMEEYQQTVGRQPDIAQQLLAVMKQYVERATQRELQASKDNIKLQMLFDKVNHKLSHKWSVTELASLVHLSQPHFHRLCRQEFGIAPLQYVNLLRIRRAEYLLKHSNYSVAYIAQMLGYADTFGFSHRFKKEKGMSPSAFRKQQ